MKRNFWILLIVGLLSISPTMLLAQNPPHPGDPTGGGTVVGGEPPAGAPIGSGTLILFSLAAAYATRKVYVLRAVSDEE